MIKNMITSSISECVKQEIADHSDDSTSKNFITLNSYDKSHYVLSRTKRFKDDFKVTLHVVTNTYNEQCILSGLNNFEFEIAMISGAVQVRVGDGIKWVVELLTTTEFNDYKYNRIEFIKSGTSYVLTVDGTIASSAVAYPEVKPSIKYVGLGVDVQYTFDGIVSDLVIKDLLNYRNSDSWTLGLLNGNEEISDNGSLIKYVQIGYDVRETFTLNDKDIPWIWENESKTKSIKWPRKH